MLLQGPDCPGPTAIWNPAPIPLFSELYIALGQCEWDPPTTSQSQPQRADHYSHILLPTSARSEPRKGMPGPPASPFPPERHLAKTRTASLCFLPLVPEPQK